VPQSLEGKRVEGTDPAVVLIVAQQLLRQFDPKEVTGGSNATPLDAANI